MSSKNPEPIAIEDLPSIPWRGKLVLTTEVLADRYGTKDVRIWQNYNKNKDRFVEGKHLFSLRGEEVAELRRMLRDALSHAQNCDEAGTSLRLALRYAQIDPKTRNVTLWTKRGAARHAKMLETDEAWEVFEALEDAYFERLEGGASAQPAPFDPRSGDLSSTPVMAYSKRFWEEAERLGLKDPQEIAKALNWNRSKVWHFLNMHTQVKKAQDFHVLIGRGFDLRYLIYGERTFSRTELDLIGAYRANDTKTVQQIAAHRPLKTLTDET